MAWKNPLKHVKKETKWHKRIRRSCYASFSHPSMAIEGKYHKICHLPLSAHQQPNNFMAKYHTFYENFNQQLEIVTFEIQSRKSQEKIGELQIPKRSRNWKSDWRTIVGNTLFFVSHLNNDIQVGDCYSSHISSIEFLNALSICPSPGTVLSMTTDKHAKKRLHPTWWKSILKLPEFDE